MLESNPSRNSQLETHPNDERGRRLLGRRLDYLDRFPHAFQNSSSEVAAKRHPCFYGAAEKISFPRMPYKRRSAAESSRSMAGF